MFSRTPIVETKEDKEEEEESRRKRAIEENEDDTNTTESVIVERAASWGDREPFSGWVKKETENYSNHKSIKLASNLSFYKFVYLANEKLSIYLFS